MLWQPTTATQQQQRGKLNNKLENYVNEFLNLFSLVETSCGIGTSKKKKLPLLHTHPPSTFWFRPLKIYIWHMAEDEQEVKAGRGRSNKQNKPKSETKRNKQAKLNEQLLCIIYLQHEQTVRAVRSLTALPDTLYFEGKDKRKNKTSLRLQKQQRKEKRSQFLALLGQQAKRLPICQPNTTGYSATDTLYLEGAVQQTTH